MRSVLAGLGTLAVVSTAMPAAADDCPDGSWPGRPGSSRAQYWGEFIDGTQRVGQELTPFTIDLPGPVAQVGASNSTAYALLTDGRLYAWGLGNAGQLGNGTTTNSPQTPVQVKFPAGVKIASIPTDSVPYDEALAIDTAGHVWGWGTNPFGDALCLGTRAPQLVPVELPFSDVTLAAGAYGHALYKAHGTVYACGLNTYGELGDGTRLPSSTPVKVKLPADAKVAKLVAAWQNSGALLADGRYFNWGFNFRGQLGQGVIGGSGAVPLRVRLPKRVSKVAQGGSLHDNGQSFALLPNGDLYAWGDGRQYQLATGNTLPQPLPVEIDQPDGGFKQVCSGGSTGYGITGNGDVYAWGNNTSGQVGDGTTTTARLPVHVADNAVSISSTDAVVVVGLG